MAAPAISDLIKQITVGELILPEFQRGYVWTTEQVKKYTLSLYRQYPTGHFLIWKTYKPQRSRGQTPPTENSFSRLILDGQQRLTSVYTLFEGKPPAFYEEGALYFNLYFDLIEEDFQFFQKSKMADNPLWIAVTPFLKKGINQFLAELDNHPSEVRDLYLKHLAKFNKLDSIRGYTYHLDEVADKSVQEIVQIFNLVNSSGTELSKADLALARICVNWPEARDTLREAQEHFAGAGFNFELEFLTRCISAVAVGNVSFEGRFDQVASQSIRDAWSSAERALEYLVNILRNDAYIDSYDTLTSPYPLLLLVVFLSRNGGVFRDEQTKRSLLYWMYLALMWGRYSGSMETALQADVNTLSTENYLQVLLNNMLQQRGRLKVEPQDLEGQGTGSRFYPLAYIVARSRGALDWFTGMKLYNSNIGKSYGLEDHHIFPQSVLYKSGYEKRNSKHRKIVNEIANRAFMTKKANLRASNALPEKYFSQVITKFPKALQAQFVPTSEKLWSLENYSQFLAKRRKLIATAINDFLEALKADTPSETADQRVKELISAGESQSVEFKSSMRWDYNAQAVNKDLQLVIVKTVAGFMNNKGGTLLIGIGPSGEILGLQNDYATFTVSKDRDEFEQKLVSLLVKHLGKEFVPLVNTNFISVDGKDVCWIYVEPSPKPIYLEDQDGTARFYVRLGNTTQPMNPKEIAGYVLMRWQVPQSSVGVAVG